MPPALGDAEVSTCKEKRPKRRFVTDLCHGKFNLWSKSVPQLGNRELDELETTVFTTALFMIEQKSYK